MCWLGYTGAAMTKCRSLKYIRIYILDKIYEIWFGVRWVTYCFWKRDHESNMIYTPMLDNSGLDLHNEDRQWWQSCHYANSVVTAGCCSDNLWRQVAIIKNFGFQWIWHFRNPVWNAKSRISDEIPLKYIASGLIKEQPTFLPAMDCCQRVTIYFSNIC